MTNVPAHHDESATSGRNLQPYAALLSPLLSVVFLGFTSQGLDMLDCTDVDWRYAFCVAAISLPLVVNAVAVRKRRGRWLHGGVGILSLLASCFPHAYLAASWLSLSVIGLWIDAGIDAVRQVAQWRRRSVESRLLAVMFGVTMAYVALGAFVFVYQMQLAILSARVSHLSPRIESDEEEVTFETEDGYLIRGTYTMGSRDAGVLLVHGRADARERWRPWITPLKAEGVHVLWIDLRGNGRSPGSIVTFGQREGRDVRAAFDWLHDRASQVVVGATSMGSGTVMYVSRQLDAEGAVLLAPASRYAPLVDDATGFLGPLQRPILALVAPLHVATGHVPLETWTPVDFLAPELDVLIVHGTDDRTIPIEMSREVAERERVELVELIGVEHDEIPDVVGERHWIPVRDFLREHFDSSR